MGPMAAEGVKGPGRVVLGGWSSVWELAFHGVGGGGRGRPHWTQTTEEPGPGQGG